jgi:signal transduction histidine kinase
VASPDGEPHSATPSVRLPDGVEADLWAAFARAADAVAAAGPRESDAGITVEELHKHLRAIAAAVHQTVAGSGPRLQPFSVSAPPHSVLDRLRSAFISQASGLPTPPATEGLIAVLCAMERVRAAIDEDVSQRFASRLSGRDGLELIVDVAHDLRSPLASVLFLADTLRKAQSGPVNSVQERQLGLIYSAAFGLSTVVSDVIELARGGDRLVDLHPVPFAVSDIMQSVRDIVQPMVEEKRLEVRMTLPDADFRVGHPGALNRVLLNLTTNALKFTAKGYVELCAKQLSRTALQFSVRDTGRGIPEEVMSSLFDTFRPRGTSGEFTFSSAGLGLSICRKLVAAMGGELAVDTAPGYGTRFYFTLELPQSTRM